jgi:hypothetical protein
MDWKCGSKGRAYALQAQSPELKAQSHKKQTTKPKTKKWWDSPYLIRLYAYVNFSMCLGTQQVLSNCDPLVSGHCFPVSRVPRPDTEFAEPSAKCKYGTSSKISLRTSRQWQQSINGTRIPPSWSPCVTGQVAGPEVSPVCSNVTWAEGWVSGLGGQLW